MQIFFVVVVVVVVLIISIQINTTTASLINIIHRVYKCIFLNENLNRFERMRSAYVGFSLKISTLKK